MTKSGRINCLRWICLRQPITRRVYEFWGENEEIQIKTLCDWISSALPRINNNNRVVENIRSKIVYLWKKETEDLFSLVNGFTSRENKVQEQEVKRVLISLL